MTSVNISEENMKDCIMNLQEVSDELYEERRELQSLVNQNQFQIEKINTYLKGLFEKEDTDFKVFSPRNIETVYKEQIESNEKEKEQLESDNLKYYKKINSIDKQLEKIERVLENISKLESSSIPYKIEEDVFQEEYVENNISVTEILQDKNHISHRIKNIISIIDVDRQRAKIELAAIVNSIENN